MTARLSRSAGATGLLALVFSVAGCGKPPQPLAPPDAPTVAVQHPAMRGYTPTKEFTGRLATKDPVHVQPQVSGMIVRRAFKEGETVKGPVRLFGAVVRPGDLLFEIDKTLYDADLWKAKADVLRAEADIKNWGAQIRLADAELTRVDEAFKKGAGPKTDLDKALANLDVAKAQLDSSRATKESAIAAQAKAAENLRYCTITAPATGRVGIAQVAEKSVVDAYKATLVDVYPVDPIYAIWEVDELNSLWYRAEIEAGKVGDPRKGTLMCSIMLKDEKTFSAPVPITYYDPEIIRGTGTRTIRAEIPNPDRPGRRLYSSGDSVRVRVDAGGTQQVLTVPETAVFAQQQRRYVYVATATPEGDKAELREVEPGASFDGFVIVEQGLTTADRVIVDNLLRVRPGVKVQAKQ
ncbi:MAG: hypothetical protein JWO38_1936 [Gemmataceae bacterium]|nr:hypothetical protein [Gemmataceae bacterium]